MISISRWYCSISKEERPKSQFVTIKEYLFNSNVLVISHRTSIVENCKAKRYGVCFLSTLEIIPAICARRNGFWYQFIAVIILPAITFFLLYYLPTSAFPPQGCRTKNQGM